MLRRFGLMQNKTSDDLMFYSIHKKRIKNKPIRNQNDDLIEEKVSVKFLFHQAAFDKV